MRQDHDHGTSVFPSLCMRLRFRKSDCQECAKVCPEGAISLQHGPTISRSCTACGLCQVACPTEAIEVDRCSELLLLNHIESVRPEHGTRAATRGLSFLCRRAASSGTGAPRVRCVGAISENVLISAALRGFPEVVVVRGECARCRWDHAEGLLERSIRSAMNFIRAVGITEFRVRVEVRDNNGAAVVGRREIVSDLGRRLRSRITAATEEARVVPAHTNLPTDPVRNAYPVAVPTRRRRLQRIAGDLNLERPTRLSYDPDLPWGMVRVDAARCGACGICAVVCPTGAIRRSREGDSHILTCSISDCANCRLCVEACPDHAIGFEDSVAVADVCTAGTTIIARVRMTTCAICGEGIPAREGVTCATCETRRISNVLSPR